MPCAIRKKTAMADKKIRVTFKDPDVVHDAIYDYVSEQLGASDLDDDEKEAVREIREEKLAEQLKKWVMYGEYIKIEFDLEAGTAVVLPAKD